MTYNKFDSTYIHRVFLAAGVSLLLVACGDNGDSSAPADDEAAATEDTASADSGAAVGSEDANIVFGEVIFGSPDAPVEIIEYASFSCPHCAAFHIQTMPQLKSEFIDTGIVRFHFRNFVRDQADLTASMAARCKGPDRVYGLTDLFFRQQGQWLGADYEDELAQLARRAGMNRAEFDRCVSNKALERDMVELRNDGISEYSVQVTPTFIINGDKVEGALPIDQMAELIRENQ